jgi:SWI/SNF-related matrix-associated actin-dependent regulator 1 of chromatin subfamily A|tara:strand:- start:5511 stop:6779 length:1269 start_codon:yes stop_codon:yes gene_type:complete
MKLEEYQITGANFLAENYHALLADEMGIGKTAQAIRACDFICARSILIICPASVKIHWQEEFRKWSLRKLFLSIIENGKSLVDEYAEVIIINYDLLQRDRIFNSLKARNWDVIILDEGHYLKTLTSKRSVKVLGSFGIARSAKYKWMLTGTPIENRPVDLFPLLYTLGRKHLGKYDSYESYVMHFCDGYYDHVSGKPMPNGATNELELRDMLKGFMLRRTLKDALPKADVQIIRMEKNIQINKLESECSFPSYFKPMAELGALASLRQEVALAKLPQCIQYIKDTLMIVDKLVVFAYHRSVINQLAEALGRYYPVKFFGGLTISQRENVKNYFVNDPKSKVFIGQLKAAGVGLDGLQKVAHQMIFVEVDWIPFRQCIGRLRRMGQEADKVIVQLLVCKDSIEEQMLGTINSKLKSINKILGD